LKGYLKKLKSFWQIDIVVANAGIELVETPVQAFMKKI